MSVILQYVITSCFSWCLLDSLYIYFNHTNSSHPIRKKVYYLVFGWGEFFCPASKQRKDPGNEVESFLFLMITLLMIWYNSFNVIVNGVAEVGRPADQ